MANDFDDLLFRSSKVGTIISKSGKITQGVETYLKQIYFQVKKGFKEEVTSKYLEKGKFCEEDSITMLQNTLFRGKNILCVKNKERVSDSFTIGEHDVKVGSTIIDCKNCWDWITFENADLTWEYEWQIRDYMRLNKCDTGILFYCLLNLPEHMLIEKEMQLFRTQKKWATNEDPDFIEACVELRKMYNFEKYPPEERFKAFTIERDIAYENKIIKSVKEARAWLNEFHKSKLELHEINRKFMNL